MSTLKNYSVTVDPLTYQKNSSRSKNSQEYSKEIQRKLKLIEKAFK